MNEIKFRAWDENRMVEVVQLNLDTTEHLVRYEGKEYIANISEENVMQYAGLTAKKSDYEDIFTGDILMVESPKGEFKAQVVYELGTFGIVGIKCQVIDYFEDNYNDEFLPLTHIHWNTDYTEWIELSTVEIIGNIYENPELMEDN